MGNLINYCRQYLMYPSSGSSVRFANIGNSYLFTSVSLEKYTSYFLDLCQDQIPRRVLLVSKICYQKNLYQKKIWYLSQQSEKNNLRLVPENLSVCLSLSFSLTLSTLLKQVDDRMVLTQLEKSADVANRTPAYSPNSFQLMKSVKQKNITNRHLIIFFLR